MSAVLCVTNQKGGVAKTTTAAALLDGMASDGIDVFGIDMDPQGDLSSIVDPSRLAESSSELVLGTVSGHPASGSVFHSDRDSLVGLTSALADGSVGIDSLRSALESVCSPNQVAIIDTPPNADILTVLSLAAADYVLIPTTADRFGTMGVRHVIELIAGVDEQFGRESATEVGVVFTRYEALTRVHREFATAMTEQFEKVGIKVMPQRIGRSTAIVEAQAAAEPIYERAGRIWRGAIAQYRLLTQSVEVWMGLSGGQ